MAQVEKTVFISYRRESAGFVSLAIYQYLQKQGYDVFLDTETLGPGKFDTVIMNQIAARAHFLSVLTPGTLERCAEPDDWVRREIEEAIRLERNIVPLLVNGFEFDESAMALLTGGLSDLPRYNGLEIPNHKNFSSLMARLETEFLSQPIDAFIKEPPPDDEPIVDQKIAEVAAQPPVTADDLSAEEYLILGLARAASGDMAGAIADYTEAIRIKPHYAEAYNNRGNVRANSEDTACAEGKDLAGAIADYTEAIRIKPHYAEAYNNRGNARAESKDLAGAIADYIEAIRIKPDYAEAYYNRGVACAESKDLAGAIADYTEAIRIKPDLAEAYYHRGVAYGVQNNLRAAILDFQKYLDLGGGGQFCDELETLERIEGLKDRLDRLMFR